ncbi:MAG: hypothetical protein CBC12_05340 [Candidatus Puniceispirillum sp. TMED52]|jgi:hypothetical protein|nr:MAG: hypothetical protein CBC12_05340 [Candidatus Puniceispirillum sp. TMED52]RPF82252.1 MAG: hypothetical protein CBC65_000735 [Rhodothermaceae bacterium TMED105]
MGCNKNLLCVIFIILVLYVLYCRHINSEQEPEYDQEDLTTAWTSMWKQHCREMYVDLKLGDHVCVVDTEFSPDTIIDEVQDKLKHRQLRWTKKRHANYPTTDIPVTPKTLPITNSLKERLLKEVVAPEIKRAYDIDENNISYQEAFVVRYSASNDHQHGLKPHVDGSPLSFVCALNDDFVGGGTRFIKTGDTYNLKKGQCCIFPGINQHEGVPVTKGERWILTGFLNYGPTALECKRLFRVS